MSVKPETKFRRRVRRDLKALAVGNPLWFEAIQQKAIKGSPDYILCANGHFIALELKSADGELSKLQKIKLDDILAAKGLPLVAYPSNWLTTLATIVFYVKRRTDDHT